MKGALQIISDRKYIWIVLVEWKQFFSFIFFRSFFSSIFSFLVIKHLWTKFKLHNWWFNVWYFEFLWKVLQNDKSGVIYPTCLIYDDTNSNSHSKFNKNISIQFNFLRSEQSENLSVLMNLHLIIIGSNVILIHKKSLCVFLIISLLFSYLKFRME